MEKTHMMFEPDEHNVRYHARKRGFQIIRVRGREAGRRNALGLGSYMLIDDERVHLFAASLSEIADYVVENYSARRRLKN
jgi:hypothetical protein